MEGLQPPVGLLCAPMASPAWSPRAEPMWKGKNQKHGDVRQAVTGRSLCPEQSTYLKTVPSRIRKVLQSRSHNVVIRVYDDAGNVTERTSTLATPKRDNEYRLPPCCHWWKFGFVFRVKHRRRRDGNHRRLVIRAAQPISMISVKRVISVFHWLFFTNRICLHVRNFEIPAVSIFGDL